MEFDHSFIPANVKRTGWLAAETTGGKSYQIDP
jgi:hypothetical protein